MKKAPEYKQVKFGEIEVWDKNPRNIRKEKLVELAESLKENGQIETLLCWEGDKKPYQTGGGNMRWHAMKEILNYDDDKPVQICMTFPETEEEKIRLSLISNMQYGFYELEHLAELIYPYKDTLDLDNLRVEIEDFENVNLREVLERLTPEGGEGAHVANDKEFGVYPKDAIILAAFDYFRQTGFPFPVLERHEMMQEINQLFANDDETLKRTNAGYRVADTFHSHRFECTADSRTSPIKTFEDDKKLKKAIEHEILYNGKVKKDIAPRITLIEGAQACSNFRPGVACYIYRKHGKKNGLSFDFSMGYGGRLVGWLASGIGGTYVGVEPCKATFKGNMRLAKELIFGNKFTFINKPFEDIDITEYKGKCDLIFTSPPYFSKEHYSDEPTQSFKRYETYDLWLEKFLRPALSKSFELLKKGRKCVINVDDVKIRDKTYALVQSTLDCAADAGFKLVEKEVLEMSKMLGSNLENMNPNESILVFRK